MSNSIRNGCPGRLWAIAQIASLMLGEFGGTATATATATVAETATATVAETVKMTTSTNAIIANALRLVIALALFIIAAKLSPVAEMARRTIALYERVNFKSQNDMEVNK